MTPLQGLAILALLVLLVQVPVAAVHSEHLDIAIDREGNAAIAFEYSLPWTEQVLAFLGMVNPDRDLGRILVMATGGEIDSFSGGPGITTFTLRRFANMTRAETTTSYATPVLNLSWGEQGYKSSLLAPLLEPDFSPDVTVVRFPDAYSLTYRDQCLIPNITHVFSQ